MTLALLASIDTRMLCLMKCNITKERKLVQNSEKANKQETKMTNIHSLYII